MVFHCVPDETILENIMPTTKTAIPRLTIRKGVVFQVRVWRRAGSTTHIRAARFGLQGCLYLSADNDSAQTSPRQCQTLLPLTDARFSILAMSETQVAQRTSSIERDDPHAEEPKPKQKSRRPPSTFTAFAQPCAMGGTVGTVEERFGHEGDIADSWGG